MSDFLRVLIVDDWHHRHIRIKGVFENGGRPALFVSRMTPADVTEADLDLAEVVFLDHDMCRGPEGESCPFPCETGAGQNMLNEGCGCPTGGDMVKTLIGRTKRPQCVVHTANPTGGKWMAQALYDNGFPVSWSPVSTWDRLIPSTLFKLWKI